VTARVAASPERGEANAALLALIARAFAVEAAAVTLVAGATERRKTVRVAGLPRARAVALLREALA